MWAACASELLGSLSPVDAGARAWAEACPEAPATSHDAWSVRLSSSSSAAASGAWAL